MNRSLIGGVSLRGGPITTAKDSRERQSRAGKRGGKRGMREEGKYWQGIKIRQEGWTYRREKFNKGGAENVRDSWRGERKPKIPNHFEAGNAAAIENRTCTRGSRLSSGAGDAGGLFRGGKS